MKARTWLSRNAMAPITITVLAAPSQVALAQARPDQPSERTKLVATVKSRDGTTIAYEQSGKGPVLVLVAPALSDRSGAAPFAALLAPTFTVINFDRRGRGESGDTRPYAVEREIEDIEALIQKAGGSAFLFGSSSGAALAFEAANKLTSKVKALVLFEPPYIVDDSRPPIPDGFFTEIGSLVSRDRRGDAVALFMTKGIGVPEEMVAGMKQSPMWAAMEKLAHTLPYDGAILAGLQAGKPLPAKRWTSITARTLVIDGERSDPFLRNAVRALTEVLPGAKRQTLPGQDHSAMFTAPQALAPVVAGFLGSSEKAPPATSP
jgi:pimeloyl-ACP methyl ester carboxylesterase